MLQVGATGINKIDYIFVQCRGIHLGSRQIQYPLTVQISCSFAMMEESIVVPINLFIVPSAESARSISIVFFYHLPSTLMHTLIVSFRSGEFPRKSCKSVLGFTASIAPNLGHAMYSDKGDPR
jgi:hypothetical protein